jgi:hypothetical protein
MLESPEVLQVGGWGLMAKNPTPVNKEIVTETKAKHSRTDILETVFHLNWT